MKKQYRIRVTNKETGKSMLFPAVFSSERKAKEHLATYIKTPGNALKYDVVSRF